MRRQHIDHFGIVIRLLKKKIFTDFTFAELNKKLPRSSTFFPCAIPLNRFQLYLYLRCLIKVHKSKVIGIRQIISIERFRHIVRYYEVKAFLFEYNFLVIAKLLLRHCKTPLCYATVISAIIELAQDDIKNTVKTHVIDTIGKDFNFANIFLRYLASSKSVSSNLLHNILKFFYLVACTVTACPESPWVIHLEKNNLYFSERIIEILTTISLPSDLLKDTFRMLLELSRINFSISSTTRTVMRFGLFNVQDLIDGLGDCTYLKFLIEYNDVPSINWTCLDMWLDLMYQIKQSTLTSVVQNFKFYSTFKCILIIIKKYKEEFNYIQEEQRDRKYNRLLQHFSHRVIQKCVLLLSSYKYDATNKFVRNFLYRAKRYLHELHYRLYQLRNQEQSYYNVISVLTRSDALEIEYTKVRLVLICTSYLRHTLDRYLDITSEKRNID